MMESVRLLSDLGLLSTALRTMVTRLTVDFILNYRYCSLHKMTTTTEEEEEEESVRNIRRNEALSVCHEHLSARFTLQHYADTIGEETNRFRRSASGLFLFFFRERLYAKNVAADQVKRGRERDVGDLWPIVGSSMEL